MAGSSFWFYQKELKKKNQGKLGQPSYPLSKNQNSWGTELDAI